MYSACQPLAREQSLAHTLPPTQNWNLLLLAGLIVQCTIPQFSSRHRLSRCSYPSYICPKITIARENFNWDTDRALPILLPVQCPEFYPFPELAMVYFVGGEKFEIVIRNPDPNSNSKSSRCLRKFVRLSW